MPKSFTTNPAAVIAAEQEWLTARRKKLREEGQPTEQSPQEISGLALSGGGIRSATFCLGVLQALERYGLLREFDYLSTVSGGGYIGSSLTWFMSYLGSSFPFGTKREDHSGMGGQVLSWLRAHGNYLVPGDSSRLWSLIAALVMGTALNLIVLVPVIALLFYVLLLPLCASACGNLFSWLLPAASALCAFFLAATILLALFTKNDKLREVANKLKWRRFSGPVLMSAVICAGVGTIPLAWDWLVTKGAELWASPMLSVTGALSMWRAWQGRKDGNETSGMRSLFLSLGLTLLIYGIFLLIYGGVLCVLADPALVLWAYALLLTSILLATFADVNLVSMHSFYRDSLARAYLPCQVARQAAENLQTKWQWKYQDRRATDACYLRYLAELHKTNPTSSPYHLINTAQITVGSRNAKLRGRGADNFIFSPYYCGSASTGWESSDTFNGGKADLATAFAISGAAVNPNSFATRSRPVAFIMSLLNIRLGYWIRRPTAGNWLKQIRIPHWYTFMLGEMLGRGLNENTRRLHLADGGHFENLGAYELLRRRCARIVIVDAGQDKGFHFSELAKIIEMARVDFGANITIDTKAIQPADDHRSAVCYAKGAIEYITDTGTSKGELLYLKPVLTADLTAEDVKGYARDHRDFPHESTGDQFFDEAQFEAYRELGYRLVRNLAKDTAKLEPDKPNSLKKFFSNLP